MPVYDRRHDPAQIGTADAAYLHQANVTRFVAKGKSTFALRAYGMYMSRRVVIQIDHDAVCADVKQGGHFGQ